jgi:outer membrane protein assembly factor BamB
MLKFNFREIKKISNAILYTLSLLACACFGQPPLLPGSSASAASKSAKTSISKSNSNFSRRSTSRSQFDLTALLKKCRTLENVGNAFIASDNAVEKQADNNNLFLYFSGAENNYKLESADKKDARRIWAVSLGGKMVSGLLIDGENLFLIIESGDKYILKSISRLTGVTNWQSIPLTISTLESGKEDEFFLHVFGDTVIAIGRGGEIYSYGKNDGRARWNVLLEKHLTAAPAFEENLVALALADGNLKIVSLTDGGDFRNLRRGGAASAVSTVSAVIFQTVGRIIYGDNRGVVTAVDVGSGRTIWKMRSAAAAISGVNRAAGGLLISSLDNFVYFVSSVKGKRLWKRRLGGRVVYRPLILGDYAIVINSFAPRADIIELISGKIVNQIDLEQGNYFTGEIVFGGELLAFQTAEGLNVFFADGACSTSITRAPRQNPVYASATLYVFASFRIFHLLTAIFSFSKWFLPVVPHRSGKSIRTIRLIFFRSFDVDELNF